jgi:hypothetical protein
MRFAGSPQKLLGLLLWLLLLPLPLLTGAACSLLFVMISGNKKKNGDRTRKWNLHLALWMMIDD